MMDSLTGIKNGKTLESHMSKPTFIYTDDLGRKVYKVTNYYTVKTEEFVKVAEGEDPFDVWLDQGGIDHDKINQHILHEGPHTEAHYAEAFGNEHEVEYIGTVTYDEDNEYAEEDGDVILNDLVPEKVVDKTGTSC